MIICSCTVITDHDIELALLEIMIEDDAPIPTPGIVWRHLQKKMNCCGCAPFAVDIIYQKLVELEAKGLISPDACQNALDRRWRQTEAIAAPLPTDKLKAPQNS